MTDSSQKFIARNRAPRVQIEYDVELYGSEKKVQLPFVMGVMSDLAGKSKVEQPSIDNRQFLEIDADNFDDRMNAMKPRASFSVPNTLTGEGQLNVDLTFEKMDDFSPQAIAAKIEPLRELLEARTQLSNLMTYMDGKVGAEALIEKILSDDRLMKALSQSSNNDGQTEAALDSLRGVPVENVDETANTDGVLEELKSITPHEEPSGDTSANVLAALSQTSIQEDETNSETKVDDVLKGLQDNQLQPERSEDSVHDALEALKNSASPEEKPDSSVTDTLANLAAAGPEEAPEDDGVDSVLGMIARSEDAGTPNDDVTEAALSSLAAMDVPEAEVDSSDDVLSELADAAPEEAPETDDVAAALDDLAAMDVPEAEEDSSADVLSELANAAPEETPETDDVAAALDDLAAMDVPEAEEDSSADVLSELANAAPEETSEPDDVAAALDDLAAMDVPEAEEDSSADVLSELADAAPEEASQTDNDLDGLLADLDDDDTSAAADEAPAADDDAPDDLDNLLADLDDDDTFAEVEEAPAPDDDAPDDLDDLLADLDGDDTSAAADEAPAADDDALDDLDDLLADLDDDGATAEVDEAPAPGDNAPDDLDDLLADLDGDDESAAVDEAPAADDDALDDLDSLLADLDDDDAPEEGDEAPAPDDDALDDLDDLLADLDDDDTSAAADGAPAPDDDVLDDLDSLLADLDDDDSLAAGDESAASDDLDSLMSDLDIEADESETATGSGEATLSDEGEFAFGLLNEGRPDAQQLNRKRFRLALLGDFSGRSARGALEIGDALAERRAITLDPDTVEDVIEGFATTLVLPIGKDGAGVEVRLNGLDDLHPDELYENVEIFVELVGLRSQLGSGATAESAMRQLREWGEAYGTPVKPHRSRSSGNAVPADLKLSDFQKLIGDTQARPSEASPIEDLMARIVGPHIRAVPDADVVAMRSAVNDALSAAMRLVLHHPEFQSVEGQWRSIDLIARSIETDDTLEVMLYDVSAEEIAADLATAGELTESGFARMLTEQPLDPELGRGGYSAIIGLYAFEETPPHAELLGRISRVAAHVDAPFLTSLSQAFMDTEKEDRHPLVATAWDTLRAMPEAGHLGLVSPRFLLRRPYGAKSEPIYEFEFEEFTMAAGLRSMLWANPVVLVAILLAKSFRENGASMGLGSIMSLGGMPYHYVNDQYGDQVALPCTERNLTQDKVEKAMARGVMPVVSIKGRDEIRLASFQSVAGGDILGPWTNVPPPPPSPPRPEPALAAAARDDDDGDIEDNDDDLDALLADFEDDSDDVGDLDADDDDDDMDAELAALLGDL